MVLSCVDWWPQGHTNFHERLSWEWMSKPIAFGIFCGDLILKMCCPKWMLHHNTCLCFSIAANRIWSPLYFLFEFECVNMPINPITVACGNCSVLICQWWVRSGHHSWFVCEDLLLGENSQIYSWSSMIYHVLSNFLVNFSYFTTTTGRRFCLRKCSACCAAPRPVRKWKKWMSPEGHFFLMSIIMGQMNTNDVFRPWNFEKGRPWGQQRTHLPPK